MFKLPRSHLNISLTLNKLYLRIQLGILDSIDLMTNVILFFELCTRS